MEGCGRARVGCPQRCGVAVRGRRGMPLGHVAGFRRVVWLQRLLACNVQRNTAIGIGGFHIVAVAIVNWGCCAPGGHSLLCFLQQSAWAVWWGPSKLTNGGNGIYLMRHCTRYAERHTVLHDDVGGYMPWSSLRHKPWTGPVLNGILHGNAHIACAVRVVSVIWPNALKRSTTFIPRPFQHAVCSLQFALSAAAAGVQCSTHSVRGPQSTWHSACSRTAAPTAVPHSQSFGSRSPS